MKWREKKQWEDNRFARDKEVLEVSVSLVNIFVLLTRVLSHYKLLILVTCSTDSSISATWKNLPFHPKYEQIQLSARSAGAAWIWPRQHWTEQSSKMPATGTLNIFTYILQLPHTGKCSLSQVCFYKKEEKKGV